MPEKPYAYDRCAELGIKHDSKVTLESCAVAILTLQDTVKSLTAEVLRLRAELTAHINAENIELQ